MDRRELEHLARLASLSLDPEEAGALAKDLAAIVEYVKQLDTLDTKDAPPTAQMELGKAAWREDALSPCLPREEALSQAPDVKDDGFAVPAPFWSE
jgi:aspartyl-tRNA(Asn)/glutamyl-tRNA(Gln) amidotransferase subunit C